MKTRKILSIVLSLVMILTALPLTAVNSFAETSGDFDFYILDHGTAEIIRYIGSATNLVIPSTLDGYTVTSIGWEAFYWCTSLTSITIPDSITSIGWGAFCDCTSLTSVTIPNSVTSIGDGAFSWCPSLTSITIPDSVTSIGDGAFSWCPSLTSINVKKANENYCSVNGVLFNKDKTELICYPAGKTDISYTIPDSVTSIESFAFSVCTSLESIAIPNSVTSIGSDAFCNCTSLTEITIPEGVTSIGSYAFCNCTSLTEITIPEGVTSIGDDAFYNTAYYNNSDNWENGVLYIGHHLVATDVEYNSETDTHVTTVPSKYSIKEGTITIADWAFGYCTSLESIIIPDSVTYIGNRAFGYYWNYETREYEKIEGFTIYGYEGTEAERYANDNGFTFIALEKEPIVDPDDPNPVDPNPIDPNPVDPNPVDPNPVDPNPVDPNPVDPNPVDPSTTPDIGDVSGDGKITIADAKWVLQSIAKTRNLDETQTVAADLNGDGKVTIADAKWILQVVAGTRVL